MINKPAKKRPSRAKPKAKKPPVSLENNNNEVD